MSKVIERTFRPLTFCAFLLALAAHADELHDCIAIKDDTARLACYDRALGRNVAAPPATAADTEFGLSGALKQKKEPAKKVPETVTMRVASVQKNADGTFDLAMDNQQTWRTLETSWSIDFAPADEVIVKRGFAGSYLLRKSKENRTLRATRID